MASRLDDARETRRRACLATVALDPDLARKSSQIRRLFKRCERLRYAGTPDREAEDRLVAAVDRFAARRVPKE